MERPKRQTKMRWKYDEDEFVIPEEAAKMYWEANTRKIYRVLGHKDVKTTLKDTEVHILWPGDGKWYLAEVDQIRVKDMVAFLRYPETNEEEEVSLEELINEKCIAVIEHLPMNAKLKRGYEIPVTEKDAEGAEYEDVQVEESSQQQQGSQQQRKPATPGSAWKNEDSDFDAEQDSDAEVLSDDEKFDSDADVSDDQLPSDAGEDGQAAAAADGARKKKRKKSSEHHGKHRDGTKLNTPSRGLKQSRVSGAPIGPVAAPGLGGDLRQQQLLPMGSGSGPQSGMMFVPMGATGAAAAGANMAGLGLYAAGNGAASSGLSPAQHQGMLGKRRPAEGQAPGSHAKRRAGGDSSEDVSGDGSAAGSDAFKRAMLEKLLAKKSATGASGSTAAGATPVGRTGSLAGRRSFGVEKRLSGSGSGGTGLARALSEVEVRQKAAAQLAAGLKKAVEEAQAKHSSQQQQAAAGAADAAPVVENAAGAPATADAATEAAAAAAGEAASQPPPVEQPAQQGSQQQQQPAGEQQSQQQDEPVPGLRLPEPQELATTIEEHLFDLCGAVNNEYKTKLRSLVFNLRDPQNPDLREHVLKGQILPSNLVRMSAADLANKDLAEWRRKIEEEHNKAIELDVEAAAKFSTAAAWATREDRLRKAEIAQLGTIAEAKMRKTTPEPERTPPPLAAAQAAAGEQHRRPSESSAAVSEVRDQQQPSSSAGAGTGYDSAAWDADAAGGSTPTHPASDDDGEDMEIDNPELIHSTVVPAAAARGSSSGHAGLGMGDTQAELDRQRSEQLSNLLAGTPGAPAASASLMMPAGSIAGGTPAALQQLGSVTSKTSGIGGGGLLAGIDWAAIKNEALKVVPKEQQQPAMPEVPELAAAADDAPYNPDDDEADENDNKPYDPSEVIAHDTAAAGADGSASAAAGASRSPAATAPPVDPNLPDFLPVIAARDKRTGPGPTPGDTVWQGTFTVHGAGSFAGSVKHVGGMGVVGQMLGSPGQAVEIIGRVALDKFADFTEELRKSRSRTISLGAVSIAPDAAPMDAAYMHELLRSYSSKGRIGKLGLAREIEGYLVARSEYVSRLLRTAVLVAPNQHQHLVPRDLASNEFLLLIVHRKDYVPPQHAAAAQQPELQQLLPAQLLQPQQGPSLLQLQPISGAPAPQQVHGQQLGHVPGSETHGGEGARLDPRRRAAASAAGQQQQQQQQGVPPPPPPPPAAAASASPGPGQPAADATAPAGGGSGMSAAPVGIDLHSLSALAAALGLPGPPHPQPVDSATAAGMLPGSNAAAGAEQQQQPTAGPLPGPPPPPPAPGAGTGFSPAQGPASGAGAAGLLAALQQQGFPPPPAVGAPGPEHHQQHQQFIVDMRPAQGPPGPAGPEQMVFDLRQQQQQQQQHMLPPDPAILPPIAGPPAPPGAAGGAPVIILPPGAPIPARGSMGIPDNAVFMTQDAATGAFIPVGGSMPAGAMLGLPPGEPPPPAMFPPGQAVGAPPYDHAFPGGSHQPYEQVYEQPSYAFEGPPEYGMGGGPQHHHRGQPRPRGPGGGPPRPMVRSMRGRY